MVIFQPAMLVYQRVIQNISCYSQNPIYQKKNHIV